MLQIVRAKCGHLVRIFAQRRIVGREILKCPECLERRVYTRLDAEFKYMELPEIQEDKR